MLFRGLKDALSACKRCPFEVLLTPFWSPIKHLLRYYFITNWFPYGYKPAFCMCFCRYLLMFSLNLCNVFFNLLPIDFEVLKWKGWVFRMLEWQGLPLVFRVWSNVTRRHGEDGGLLKIQHRLLRRHRRCVEQRSMLANFVRVIMHKAFYLKLIRNLYAASPLLFVLSAPL